MPAGRKALGQPQLVGWRLRFENSGRQRRNDLALSIVDKLVAELPVDNTRIYVTGRSMGGFATWDAIARRPDFFAAAVPIAGGGDPQMAEQWKELPIWAFASAGDQTCPVAGTREVVEAIKNLGGMIKYTEDPKKSHGEICNAWEEQEGLAEWLFSQRKDKLRLTGSEATVLTQRSPLPRCLLTCSTQN